MATIDHNLISRSPKCAAVPADPDYDNIPADVIERREIGEQSQALLAQPTTGRGPMTAKGLETKMKAPAVPALYGFEEPIQPDTSGDKRHEDHNGGAARWQPTGLVTTLLSPELGR